MKKQCLQVMSMVSLLGLAGILVNNSIILVSVIEERMAGGEAFEAAIVGGAQDRLRAVLLTSMTTIGGLLPLMFETSLQARFIIPMAITIVFGLGVATLLVLIVVPALIGMQGDVAQIIRRWRGRLGALSNAAHKKAGVQAPAFRCLKMALPSRGGRGVGVYC